MIQHHQVLPRNLPSTSFSLSAAPWLMSLLGFVLSLQLWMVGTPSAEATGVYNMPTIRAGDANRIIDDAEVLSRLSQNELNSELESLTAKTGKEVRFVTIHRLDYGETIETFADALFEKWFPTSEAQADQVLIVLDNVTNTIAIRTGEAIKAVLPDETAASIAQETMMVPLRSGNKYNQAFLDASDRLSAILSGEPDPGAPVVADTINTEGTFAKAEDTDDRSATVVVGVLLLLATVIPMATYYLYQAFQS
ncbi:TPM domain-containing protein [Phormidium tenue FACHB-886]|nr:TPM domain-containing protein [Phormidium tenue FACHB-886]